MELGDIFKKIKNNNFKNKFFEALIKKRKFLFFLFFVLVLAYAGYLWYTSIYSYSCDESKKQSYIDSKSGKENFFNKNKNISTGIIKKLSLLDNLRNNKGSYFYLRSI